MVIFEWVLGILFGSVLLSVLARQIRVPYPALLALGGTVLAFIPGAPRIVLEPELALALFVAPILLDAAYDTSPRDLRDNWLPVTCLVLVAVCLTTGAVAIVAQEVATVPAGTGAPSQHDVEPTVVVDIHELSVQSGHRRERT